MIAPMPDQIAPSPSARAKCRGCGKSIDKGELRFGEADNNPFGEGETHRWFHVRCAALRRPEKFGPMLETQPDLPERDRLAELVKSGIEHHRFPRIAGAARASSGRAHCRHCRELIDKGSWRVVLEIWEDGRFNPMGFIHTKCAKDYFGAPGALDRVKGLPHDLAEADLAELSAALGE
jgi:hypothetical protein